MTAPLLELRDVCKSFGGIRVNDGVSFVVREGDRIALIGPNGAGKTTLVNVISGGLDVSQEASCSAAMTSRISRYRSASMPG